MTAQPGPPPGHAHPTRNSRPYLRLINHWFPLIRPYFWGGYFGGGGRLTSHYQAKEVRSCGSFTSETPLVCQLILWLLWFMFSYYLHIWSDIYKIYTVKIETTWQISGNNGWITSIPIFGFTQFSLRALVMIEWNGFVSSVCRGFSRFKHEGWKFKRPQHSQFAMFAFEVLANLWSMSFFPNSTRLPGPWFPQRKRIKYIKVISLLSGIANHVIWPLTVRCFRSLRTCH